MIAKYNRKSLLLGIPGLLLQFVCILTSNMVAAKAKSSGTLSPADSSMLLLLALGSIVGSILLIIGLCFYSKSKGHTPVLGLLGLLSCVGLIILAVLPDKAKDSNEPAA